MGIKIPEAQQVASPGKLALRTATGVAQQKANAIGGVGKALANVGGALGKVALQIQGAKNQADINEARLAIHQGQSEYLSSLANNFDEGSWLPGAQSTMEGIHQSISSRDMSPAASREIEELINREGSNFLVRVGGMAAKQSVDRARESAMLAADMAADARNPQQYEEVVSGAQSAGLISPEDASRMRFEQGKKFRSSELKEFVLTDPKGAQDSINAGEWDDLAPEQRAAGLRSARTNLNTIQREFYTDRILEMEQGESFSAEQINAWKDEGVIDAGEAVSLLNNSKSKDPLGFDSEDYIAVDKMIDEYDPRQDEPGEPNLTEIQKKMVMSNITGSAATRLRTKIFNKLDGKVSSGSSFASSTAKSAVDFYAKNGAFGLERDDDGKIIPETQKQSMDLQRRILDDVDEWLEANPNASREEVGTFVDGLVAPYKDGLNAAQLLISDEPAEAKEPAVDANGLPQREQDLPGTSIQIETTLFHDPLTPTPIAP